MKFLFTIFTFSLFFLITIPATSAVPDSVAWSVTGIGGGGGQFTPAVSPHNPNLIFVSCDMSGFYRSTDRGNTWSMLDFRQIYSSTGLATVFAPTDPDKVWDDGRRNGTRYLLSSEDAGMTWNPEWQLPGTPTDMVCARNEPLLLLVSIAGDGIYKSNNGTDFAKIEDIQSGSYKLCENGDEILIASANHLYYSSNRADNFTEFTLGQFAGNVPLAVEMNAEYWFVSTAESLYRSDDNGQTWTEVIISSDFDRGNFKFLRAEQNIVWLTTAGSGKYQSTALKSGDFGLTFEPVFFCNSSWEDTQNLNAAWLTLDFNCGWGGSAIGFDICRSDPNIAIWTDYGRTLATFDQGETWEALYSTYADDGERSAGKKWTSRGLEVTTSWDMYLDEKITQIAYTDIGGAISEDQGGTWKSTNGNGIPGEWLNTTYDFEYDNENSVLWGGFSGVHDIIGGWNFNYWHHQGSGGVAWSNDKGRSWHPLSDNGLANKPVTSIAIDYNSPSNNRTVYAAVWSDGVWRSTNAGENWIRVSEGLECGDGTSTSDGPNTHIVQVEVHPTGDIYALKTKYIRNGSIIKNDGGLYKSTDKGSTWTSISENVADCPPNPNIDLNGEHSWADPVSFTLDPEDANHIYVGAQNCNNGKVQGGLYETTDGGENWTRILQIYCAQRLSISEYYPGRMYLATTDQGVLLSDDSGSNWSEMQGFPFTHPTRITEDPRDSSMIWVNTYGGGVWKGQLIDNSTAVEELRPVKLTIKVSPNPIINQARITVSEPARIIICDIFGRIIARSDHVKEYIWRPDSGASKGIYFVKVISGNNVLVEKILL